MRNEREPPHNNGRTSVGRLAVELSVPKEIGGEGGPAKRPRPYPSQCLSERRRFRF